MRQWTLRAHLNDEYYPLELILGGQAMEEKHR